MKKYLFIAMLALSLRAFSFPIFTIVHYSWADSTYCTHGSQQWIDVYDDTHNSYSTSDSANIYIFNSATIGSQNPIYLKLTKMAYIKHVNYTSVWHPGSPGHWENTPIDSSGYLSLPLNADDSTRRIYFTMPIVFPSGDFIVNIMSYMGVHGSFQGATGIQEYSIIHNISAISYYNLLGQPIAEPNGICIREAIYSDGWIDRRKIYRWQQR